MKYTYFFFLFFVLGCNSKREIVFINSQKLFVNYSGARYEHKKLLEKVHGWQNNIDSLSSELSTASSASRGNKEKEMLHYRQVIQEKAQSEEARSNQVILGEINEYIKHFGKEKGCDFILGATDNGNIVYAAEGKDITEEVLAGLNKQYDQQHSTYR